MPSVVYAFDVNQTVWCVDQTYGVHSGVVKSVDVFSNTVNVTPVIKYTVIYTDATASSNTLTQDVVFADVDSALAYYRTLIV